MATIPEIKKRAKYLLWMDEEKDTHEVDKIITSYNQKGYDGRLIKDCKILPNERVEVTLADHPLFKIYQYFYNKAWR